MTPTPPPRSNSDDEKDEYKSIAERRVRLGLLLSEIGQANGVEVTQQWKWGC